MNTCSPQDEISLTPPRARPDHILVAEAKSGDRTAFSELWRRHSRAAFIKVYRITKNRADAEDVIQDTWMKAFVHLKSFDGRANFLTWLTRIAINSALMLLRRRRSRPETSIEPTDGDTWQVWEFADPTEDVEKHYLRRERGERLRRAICYLRPHLRTVIEIQQASDGRVKEIANSAGISISAAKSRLLRARSKLRTELWIEERRIGR